MVLDDHAATPAHAPPLGVPEGLAADTVVVTPAPAPVVVCALSAAPVVVAFAPVAVAFAVLVGLTDVGAGLDAEEDDGVEPDPPDPLNAALAAL